jgi:hypothetical protein
MISTSARADAFAAMFVNKRNTEAKLLLSENTVNGELSKLFDQMNVPETGNATRKAKAFTLKNGRFAFTCDKGFNGSNPPSTVCTFIIKQGENSGDINTVISAVGNQKAASISMTQAISSELAGIFPTDSNNSVSYLLSYPNNVAFEVQGSTSANMTIGFSAK